MVLFGFCGKLGSGKDFVARSFVAPLLQAQGASCLTLCFADQIKVNTVARHKVPFESVFEDKTEETRRLLQAEGTENGRDRSGKDVWIQHFDAWARLLSSRGIDHLLVTDVRFENEVDYIRSAGGVLIKVVAPARHRARLAREAAHDQARAAEIAAHSSETALDHMRDEDFDAVVANDPQDAWDVGRLQAVVLGALSSRRCARGLAPPARQGCAQSR